MPKQARIQEDGEWIRLVVGSDDGAEKTQGMVPRSSSWSPGATAGFATAADGAVRGRAVLGLRARR